MRLENFERKRKHKYRGDPANLAESIPRVAECGGGDARATCACRPGIAAAPCSALVAPFWRAPGERHGAPLRYPTIRGTTLGIADDTRIPPAAASDRPDTMGGSCLVPVMHWTSARRACGGVCAPLRHSRSDTGFALAASKVERSMRRCAVKLLFWHSPRYACTHPGRTILPCVLDGQTTDAFLFSPALDALFFGLPRLCLAKSTQVCCALHTSAHTTRYACLNILSMIRGFCTSPWPGHSMRGPCFMNTFSVHSAQAMSFAPGHIERTPHPGMGCSFVWSMCT